MSYVDIFLKSEDEAAMLALLQSAGLTAEYGFEAELLHFWQTENYAVELIGAIAGAEGYHANLRWFGEGMPDFGAAEIDVLMPKRVFA